MTAPDIQILDGKPAIKRRKTRKYKSELKNATEALGIERERLLASSEALGRRNVERDTLLVALADMERKAGHYLTAAVIGWVLVAAAALVLWVRWPK